ncbi:hypothetical protein Tco_0689729 [Tanacetum coccineum]
MMEVSGSYNRKDVLAESMYPPDSRIFLVPMNQALRECDLDQMWQFSLMYLLRDFIFGFAISSAGSNGTKYKGMDDLISEKFISDAVKEKEKYLKSLLNIRYKARKGEKKSDYQKIRLSFFFFTQSSAWYNQHGARRLFDKYALQLNRISGRLKEVIQLDAVDSI